jgi:hypothetical protein
MSPARALGVSLLAATALTAVDAMATPFPVIVRNHTGVDVAIEIATGTVAPCDSSANVPVFSGVIRAGEALERASGDATACVRTKALDEPLPEWSESRFVSVGRKCFGGGRHRQCVMVDPTIRIDLRR